MPPKDKEPAKKVKRKAGKQPTQRTPMQRVLILRNGKKVWSWRPWS